MFAQAIMAVRGRIDGWWNQAFTKMIRRGLAAEDAFQMNAEQAAELLAQLVALGLSSL
jgi:hypothetical protein